MNLKYSIDRDFLKCNLKVHYTVIPTQSAAVGGQRRTSVGICTFLFPASTIENDFILKLDLLIFPIIEYPDNWIIEN